MHKSCVVIGGGFAGTTVTRCLEHTLPSDWILTLISQENFFTFHPLLPEVVGASVLPGHVVAPHRQMLHCSLVCMAHVTDIDTQQRRVHYVGEDDGGVRYDQLVLACGSNANLDLVPGMAASALPLKTLGDALFLRNRVVARLEQAELQPQAAQRRWLLTFIVVGGGFSGVETAGELADFLHASLRYYKRIPPEELRIILLHSGDRLLPELSPRLGRFTVTKMSGAGVDVLLKTRVARVTDRGVQLASGDLIEGGTVVCTIGTQTNPLIEQLPVTRCRGRLTVNPDLSVPGLPGVWAAGDCAAAVNGIDGSISPPTAQFAEAQARQLAANLVAQLSGGATRPFRHRSRGQLSSIGHNKAVAEVLGLKISGFVAWLMWRGVYLLRIPTVARKARLFLEWNWAMCFPPDLSHFGYRRTRRTPHATPTADGAARAGAASAGHE